MTLEMEAITLLYINVQVLLMQHKGNVSARATPVCLSSNASRVSQCLRISVMHIIYIHKSVP